MSVDDEDEHDSSTVLTLAAVGTGAVLLWLLLRGKGKGWGGFGRGGGFGGGRDGGSFTAGYDGGVSPPQRPILLVRLVEGERILIDGDKPVSLDTMLARALTSSKVHFTTDGAVRAGFVSKVLWTLLDADIDVDADHDVKHRTARVDDPEGKVITAGKWFWFGDPKIDNCLRTKSRKECIPGEAGDKTTAPTTPPKT